MVLIRSLLLAAFFAVPASATDLPDARPGWVIERTEHGYKALIDHVDAAVGESPLNVVTRASATVGAKSLGQEIPGNMVVGVFAPQFAIRLLEASVAAGIEAPLRLYITENPDGTATLSYKTASHAFAPYAQEGGQGLTTLAGELDQILAEAVREILLLRIAAHIDERQHRHCRRLINGSATCGDARIRSQSTRDSCTGL